MTVHISVLLKESIEGLNLASGKIFLDGTLGGGGHSREVLRHFDPPVRVIGLDKDPLVIERISLEIPEIETFNESFANLDRALKHFGIEKVDAILLDLGFSSDQLAEAGRGFSFQRDEPLDMRLSRNGFTAAQILNSWDESAIELILKGFGEERYARRIANEIAKRRISNPFQTTFDLVDAVEKAVPWTYRLGKIHPATRTFQALRIAVNGELEALEEGLEKGFEALNSKGRFAVISFHSLEDRIVKNFFREKVRAEEAVHVNKGGKPIVPTEEEIIKNPRSRSAKLRIIEKI